MQVRSFVAQRGVMARAPTASRPPSRTKSQSCTGLPAEQGVLLSNRSSAGFETSAGVSRHSSEQQTERMDFSMIFEK
jgi:hypothetical protein